MGQNHLISPMETLITLITTITQNLHPNLTTTRHPRHPHPNNPTLLNTYTHNDIKINLYTIYIHPNHININNWMGQHTTRTTIHKSDPQLINKLTTTIKNILKTKIPPISSTET